MKKLFTVILCALIALSVCACSTSTDGVQSQSTSENVSSDNSAGTSAKSEISAPESKTENSENLDDISSYAELMSDSEYKAALLDAAENIDTLMPEEILSDYSAAKGGDLDPWYELPYQSRYYTAFSVIHAYARKNGFVSSEEWEAWDYVHFDKQNHALGNASDYYGAWEYVRDFNLKYEDFKDEFVRVSGLLKSMDSALTDDEIKLLFEGTKEQIDDAFLETNYTVKVGDKVYTPLVLTEKMSLKELINAGIMPDVLQNKLANIKRDYPDRYAIPVVENKYGLYKKLCDDVYECRKQGKVLDVNKWVSENNISEFWNL